MRFHRHLAIIFLTLPFVGLQAESRCPGGAVGIDLQVVAGSLIIASVQVDGSGPYHFLVDTGAQITTVDPALAAVLNLRAQGTTGVSGAGTFGRYRFGYLGRISAGVMSVERPLVVIQDLGQLKQADPQIRGILGDNFLEHFDVLLDNRNKVMCLDNAGAMGAEISAARVPLANPRGSDRTVIPFTWPLVVETRLASYREGVVLLRLDSGSNAPMLHPWAATKTRLAMKNGGQTLHRVVEGTDQSFGISQDQDVYVGGIHLRGVSFVVPITFMGEVAARSDDGMLPTMAFRRVFISALGRYASFDRW
jgi:hypothetical protein